MPVEARLIAELGARARRQRPRSRRLVRYRPVRDGADASSAAARTDVGRRPNNEDAVFASPRLAAVADGVGGAAAGEVASRTLINALVHVDKCRLQGRVEDALAAGIARGNETIGFIAGCRPAMAGMSTTVTAVALGDDGCVVANVGDSRTYLLRDGALTQLTRDDSWVQLMIDSGELTPEQARDHPQRSLVLAALDGEPDHRPGPDELRRAARRPAAAVLRRPVRRGRRRDDRGDAAHRRPRARARRA